MAAQVQEGLEELSHITLKVRKGGGEEIPLVQGKEQWLHHWTTREGLRLCYVLKGPRLPWRTAFFPGRARRSGGRGGLTSPLAALLHSVLVDVQREEHV